MDGEGTLGSKKKTAGGAKKKHSKNGKQSINQSDHAKKTRLTMGNAAGYETGVGKKVTTEVFVLFVIAGGLCSLFTLALYRFLVCFFLIVS